MTQETAHYTSLETESYRKQAEEELAACRHQIVQIMADLSEPWPLEMKLRSISDQMRLAQTYLDQASMSNAIFTVLDERDRMKLIEDEGELIAEKTAGENLEGESEELSLGL